MGVGNSSVVHCFNAFFVCCSVAIVTRTCMAKCLRRRVLSFQAGDTFAAGSGCNCLKKTQRIRNLRKKISVFVLITVAMIVSLIQPATATVVVTCQDLGGGVAQFSYNASDETILVRAFVLDVTVNNGATIESIFDYKVGISTADDPGYGIFPGSIVIDSGEVIDWGTPIANPVADTLPGLGTYGITVEMGSLYEGEQNAPLVSDAIFKIAIDWNNATMVNVNIALNTTRGGIVMEDSNYNHNIELLGHTLIPEPATVLLFSLGSLALLRKRRG